MTTPTNDAERDALAKLIKSEADVECDCMGHRSGLNNPDDIADAILAAGYRRRSTGATEAAPFCATCHATILADDTPPCSFMCGACFRASWEPVNPPPAAPKDNA